MADKNSGKDPLENVPAWVRGDPEVLADWLATDWEAEAKLFDQMGGTLQVGFATGRTQALRAVENARDVSDDE